MKFTAASTRPRPASLYHGLLTPEVDRPVCKIEESTLIAAGSTIQANVGRGLICTQPNGAGRG